MAKKKDPLLEPLMEIVEDLRESLQEEGVGFKEKLAYANLLRQIRLDESKKPEDETSGLDILKRKLDGNNKRGRNKDQGTSEKGTGANAIVRDNPTSDDSTGAAIFLTDNDLT